MLYIKHWFILIIICIYVYILTEFTVILVNINKALRPNQYFNKNEIKLVPYIL